MNFHYRANNIFHAIGAVLLVLLLASCASLPELQYLNDSLSPLANPTVNDGQGTLSTKKSRSLLTNAGAIRIPK